MNHKGLQDKSLQLQAYREQARQIQQEIMRLQPQLHEFENVKESLKQIEKETAGSEALIPVGAGIFMSGKMGSTKEFLVSAGANVMVKKTVPETIVYLDDKLGILKKAIEELEKEMHQISISAQMLSRELA